MDEAQGRCQQRLEADRAIGSFRERAPFVVGILRIVAGDDDIDVAGGQRLHEGRAILFAAQGRANFEIGSIGADVVFVQRQVIDRRATGDGELARLGGPHDVEAFTAGYGGRVVTRASHVDQPHISLQHNCLGGAMHAGQPQPRRHFARVHDATR